MKKSTSGVRIVVLPLMIALYVALLYYNLNESDRRSLRLQYDTPAADKVHLILDIVNVDVAHAEVTARMRVRLAGKIARDNFTPAVNLGFVVNTVQGQQRFELKQGERVVPVKVVFALIGEPNLYPFDTYQSTLAFLATKPGHTAKRPHPAALSPPASFPARPQKDGEEHTADPPVVPDALVGAAELASRSPVPVSFALSASIPGFKFDGESLKSDQDDVTRIRLELRRANNVIATSMGVQLMMICLALSMLAMVMFGTLRGRGPAIDPLYIAPVLIFGLPALRDTQPGVPPLGAFSDYISYLWAEYIVAGCTIVAIWAWIARSRRQIEEPVADETKKE